MGLRYCAAGRSWDWVALLFAVPLLALLSACAKKEEAKPAAQAPEVSVLTVRAQDVPVLSQFVGQTESSQQVEIRARVSGFLEKRVYTEGALVKSGQVLFLMDPKPLAADVQAAQAELAQQQARLSTARANLARVKPLVADNALAIKDLDDATGQAQGAAAAVEAANAKLVNAQLNLGYATITAPVAGITSFAKVQDGAYVSAANSLLTYVAKLDPMRVNFSLSENELLRIRDDVVKGRLRAAPRDDYVVEVLLADGSRFPARGRITFADAAFNQETGTFLLRAELPNPKGQLRPGQFVRVNVHGFTRPQAIVVPQRAVQQGARDPYVWVVDAQGKVAQRTVVSGDWMGDQWLVNSGLKDGDKVVVDGFMRLAPGVPVRVKEVAAEPLPPDAMADLSANRAAAHAAIQTTTLGATGTPATTNSVLGISGNAPAAAPTASVPNAPANVPQQSDAVFFEPARAQLDATARMRIVSLAQALQAQPGAHLSLSGYVDASGDAQRNAQLAKARAQAVRDALVAAGVPRARIALNAPARITGGGDPARARRVDITVEGAR